jgi:hypothetical protein
MFDKYMDGTNGRRTQWLVFPSMIHTSTHELKKKTIQGKPKFPPKPVQQDSSTHQLQILEEVEHQDKQNVSEDTAFWNDITDLLKFSLLAVRFCKHSAAERLIITLTIHSLAKSVSLQQQLNCSSKY